MSSIMNYKISFVLFSALIYLSINSVSSLKCHVCSSVVAGQEDCFIVEPGDTKYLMDCGVTSNGSCRTQDSWVEFEILGQQPTKRVIRQCASTQFDPVRPCYYRAGFGGKTNVCNCLGDGCNEASRIPTAYVLLTTLGSFLLYKMLV